MVILLVVMTILVCVAYDYWLQRRAGAATQPGLQGAVERAPAVFKDIPKVEGYLVPDDVRYHPGHTWAWMENQEVVRVGMDDFSRRLVGGITRIMVPKVGDWVRQGAMGFTLHRNGLSAQMVSPVDGEVVDVNREAVENPGLLSQDPYGKGWLFAVRTPNARQAMNNLLPPNMVNAWMGTAARALRFKVHHRVGMAYADGGEPVEDVVGELGVERWQELTKVFFLI